jgi:hypothetical protein
MKYTGWCQTGVNVQGYKHAVVAPATAAQSAGWCRSRSDTSARLIVREDWRRVGPDVGPTSAFCSYTATGMHGPTRHGVITRGAPGLAAPGDPGEHKRGPVGYGDLRTGGGQYVTSMMSIRAGELMVTGQVGRQTASAQEEAGQRRGLQRGDDGRAGGEARGAQLLIATTSTSLTATFQFVFHARRTATTGGAERAFVLLL